MSLRSEALQWYKTKYGKIDLPIYTSKFYPANKSWSKKSVWWPNIPTSVIEKYSEKHINILCQVAPGVNDFHHLKVPSKFLQEHIEQFHMIEELISLYLSTDSKRMFIEERGTGGLDFSVFLVNYL